MKIIELVAFLAWTSLATAMFVRPTAVPVERLEQKAAEYTKAHPEDANGWYTFARIHYLAFILSSDSLNGWEEPNGGMPHLHHEQKSQPAGLPKESDPQLAVRHVAAALQYFDKAIALQKDNAFIPAGKGLPAGSIHGCRLAERDQKGRSQAGPSNAGTNHRTLPQSV